jgi:16S rRNA (uracil1498-N3)-methyltransferase
MRRYWYPAPFAGSKDIAIVGDLFHHIFEVCRQTEGSEFELIFADGCIRLVKVEAVHKRAASVSVQSERQSTPLRKPFIHLCLSIPKIATLESVLEKAVEMGVAEVHPFVSEFSFLRSPSKISDERMGRWEKIVISATQQSGRGELMKVHAPVYMDQLLAEIHRTPQSLCLFAYEGSSQMGAREFLSRQRSRLATEPAEHSWILVGSEGGFSTTEVAQISNLGFPSVSLGDQVLRVETACMSLVSILKYEFGLMEKD